MIFTQKFASGTPSKVYFDNLIIKVFALFHWLAGQSPSVRRPSEAQKDKHLPKKDRTIRRGPLISICKPDYISCGSSRVLSAMSFLQSSTNLSNATPGTCLLEPLTLTATVFSAASLSPTTRM